MTKPRQPSIGKLSGPRVPIMRREDVTFAQPTRICSASTKGNYTGPAWNIRAGGQDHLKFKSRGI